MPMPYSVSAYIDDHLVSAVAETVKEALAKAVEWHLVGGLSDVTISDGVKGFEIETFGIGRGLWHAVSDATMGGQC